MTQNIFEDIKHINEYGNEYWKAREFYKVLEYTEYNKFIPAINRAKEACKNSKQSVEDHFAQVSEMVEIWSWAKREVEDIQLSRYACYLIIQNADPSKETVALWQTIKKLWGTMPEELPATDSIKQAEKRLKKSDTNILE